MWIIHRLLDDQLLTSWWALTYGGRRTYPGALLTPGKCKKARNPTNVSRKQFTSNQVCMVSHHNLTLLLRIGTDTPSSSSLFLSPT